MTSTAYQPSFDDLGQPLADATFVVVDLETTGGSATDTITEIGAVKVRGGAVVGEFQTLVNPQRHIPPLVTVLTGITDQLVANAPSLSAVLPSFLSFAERAVVVAHNARFDVGFLSRACTELGYEWGRPTIVDTVTLARQILPRGEVPNCKLATLAQHFRATTNPDHRALSDARATVEVFHGLLARAGNLEVATVEDLLALTSRVSPQQRAKKVWADALPSHPGVYWFEGAPKPDAEGPEVLYVGTSKNLRRRARTYFTAAEQRPRMAEMIRVATGLRHLKCSTELEAQVRELRLIAAHRPRYNRRSKLPEKTRWLKVTVEPFPRLALVRRPLADDADYFGPFTRRQDGEEVLGALHETFSIRRCTQRLTHAHPATACVLADLGRCLAPCTQATTAAEYAHLVSKLVATLTTDARPVVAAHRGRLARLVRARRYEEAELLTRRLRLLVVAMRRHHRLASVTRCAQFTGARRVAGGWEIHIFRYGRLAGATVSPDSHDHLAAAAQLAQIAETVAPPCGPQPAGLIEETALLATWLEQPGVRLIDVDGEWSWPRAAIICEAELPELLNLPSGDSLNYVQ